jgi:hypothetical protein
MEWQPISTAPKDGTLVMLWDPDGDPNYYIARWFADHRYRREGPFGPFVWTNGDPASGIRLARDVPTHWMPLPAPPAAVLAVTEGDKG